MQQMVCYNTSLPWETKTKCKVHKAPLSLTDLLIKLSKLFCGYIFTSSNYTYGSWIKEKFHTGILSMRLPLMVLHISRLHPTCVHQVDHVR